MSPAGAAPQRWILHADMDAFYASIEQRDNPALRGRPVVVGGGAARGVVAAASYEARVSGVRSAMPGFRARELCPDAVFLPPDMPRYARVSREVHEVFAEFTPDIEPIALDEAFLDITASCALFGGPNELARRLKRRVRERTDLPVSVGIAPSKLVAKIACTLSKPDGLLFVPPDSVRPLLDPLPVRRLWTVGPVLSRTLEAMGIRTIGDLAFADPKRLAAEVGPRALDLQRLARGEDTRDVESQRAPKSYGEENTFARDVTDLGLIEQTLRAHAEAVARRLRRDGYSGKTVTIKIKLAQSRGRREGDEKPDYPLHSRSRTLRRATDHGLKIGDVACALFHASGIVVPIRLIGVSVSNLELGAAVQLDLFGTKQAPLEPVLDAIRERFGRSAIQRVGVEPEKLTPTLRRKRGE